MFTKATVGNSVALLCLHVCFASVAQEADAVDIECIPVTLCPMAMRLIKTKPFANATISFLRYSHCGFEGVHAKIWCSKFKFCKTPDSKNGTCTPIKECQPYVKLLQAVDTSNPITKKYLREFRCTTEFDPKIEVCCPEEKLTHYSPNYVTASPYPNFGDEITSRTEQPVHQRFADPVIEICGKNLGSDRIFGGSEAALGQFPWMALLKYKKGNKYKYGCTGSLLNARYILTAAHCLDPIITEAKNLGELYSIVLGEHDTSKEVDCIETRYGDDCADPTKEIDIDTTITHPEYYHSKVTNDIALIRLTENLEYTDYIKPICLPGKDSKFNVSDMFYVAGWGRTETLRRSPVKLQALVPYRNREDCSSVSGVSLSRGQLCAGYGNGTDSCFGDSGGPLMLETPVDRDIITSVVGIISYGYGGSCGEYPSVYTYVPHYVDWIHRIIT